MYCGEQTNTSHDGQKVHLASVLCKRWTCPTCQPLRVRALQALGHRGAANRFLTLTIRTTPDDDVAERMATLVNAFRVLRRRLERKWKTKRMAFLAVCEVGPSGNPHLHVLARCPWIDQRWLSDAMSELADSPIVHIRHIDNPGRAARYVAKYVGKQPAKLPGSKRYWRSQDFAIIPRRPRSVADIVFNWQNRIARPLAAAIADFERIGYKVVERGRIVTMTNSPRDGPAVYAGLRP